MDENSNQQRAQVVEYHTPQRPGLLKRVTSLPFILLVVCLLELLLALRMLLARRTVPATVITGIAISTALFSAILNLRRADKQNKKARGSAWPGVVASALLLCWFLWLVFQLLVASVQRTACQHNLSAIGQTMLLYTQSEQGNFPPKFDVLISHYDVAPEVFISPSSADHAALGSTLLEKLAQFAQPGHCSYIYLGAGMTTSTITKDFVLAYEPMGNHQDDGAHFIFGDGNAEWRDAKEAKKLINQLKSGINPPKP